jgi:hypothetical protein
VSDQQTAVIALSGGLDTATAPLALAPGHVIGSENYEPRIEGGYQRVKGIERYDGRTKPSAAQIVVLGVATSWGASAVVGATATGGTSSATGVITYVSGTLLALTKVTGTWVNGEQLLVSAVNQGVVILEPSITELQSNAMYAAAATTYRADITTVPGSGPICGICVVASVVYAFRNNAGGTSQDCYRATSSGWVLVPRKKRIRFNTGSGTYVSGNVTITQGANSTTAYRIMVESGTFAGGNAAGSIIIDAPTPAVFTSASATLSGGLGTVVLESSTYADVTLGASGRWVFKPYRFAMSRLSVTPVYGVDRVDNASGTPVGGGNFIEFDGTIIAPLTAGGMDGPHRIECHKNHLFIVYRYTSIQHSAIGDPYNWTVISGAGELQTHTLASEMVSIQGSQDEGAMAILCPDRTYILYGNDSTDWNLVPLSKEVGAKPFSAQLLGKLVAYDEQGVRSYSPTDTFGNFAFNTLTNHVRSRVAGKTPVGSAVDRTGGRYRLFFSDGTWLSGFPGKRWSWMLCRYPFTPSVVTEWEISGVSSIFIGDSDGYVYECDKGRSFDGTAISAWIKTTYAHLGSPTRRKAFRSLEIEVRGDSAGTLTVQPDYSYGDTALDENVAALATNNPVAGPDAAFDLGDWDSGSWDAKFISRLRVRSPGVGENVSVVLGSEVATELSHEVTAITHYFHMRRQSR